MRMLALLLILLAPLQAHAENKVSPANVQMVMQRTVEDVIRPGYAKFEQAANALASLGVSAGDRVAIYLPMLPEAVFAMLATLSWKLQN